MTKSADLNKKVKEAFNICNSIFLGKEEQLKIAFISMLSRGHLLLEDVPGVGKTTIVHLLSQVFGLNLSRIQFTNDLLASDIIGTSVFDKKTSSFIFNQGPIFSRMVLGDELNRASPKTQSALLQAMEERYITVDGNEYKLDEPFIVIATQNPLDQVGTNPLPESQLDRFFMSLTLGLPSREYEKRILIGENVRNQIDILKSYFTLDEYLIIIKMVETLHTEDKLVNYILDVLNYARTNVSNGERLSLRAGRDLLLASKACAFFEGRDFVTPGDVKTVAPYVLSHRISLGGGLVPCQDIIKEILNKVTVR